MSNYGQLHLQSVGVGEKTVISDFFVITGLGFELDSDPFWPKVIWNPIYRKTTMFHESGVGAGEGSYTRMSGNQENPVFCNFAPKSSKSRKFCNFPGIYLYSHVFAYIMG